MLKKLSPTFRIGLSLGMISLNSIFMSQMLGLFPNREAAERSARLELCETIAMSLSTLANRENENQIEPLLRSILERSEDIKSAGVKRTGTGYLTRIGRHDENWSNNVKNATSANVFVPIVSSTGKWGTVEIAFRPITKPGFLGQLQRQSKNSARLESPNKQTVPKQ